MNVCYSHVHSHVKDPDASDNGSSKTFCGSMCRCWHHVQENITDEGFLHLDVYSLRWITIDTPYHGYINLSP